MDPFVVHPISPNAEIRVTRDMPSLSPGLDARVESIWVRTKSRVSASGAGSLFNGRIFSIDTMAPDLITGHLTEYRRLVAQAEDHALFPELGIRSLAVCGVLLCLGGVVIGRRPVGTFYQPGMWQLCPAGSVDAGSRLADGTMDYRAQLLTEIREELGLAPDAIGEARALCLVEHPGSHVSDLGMAANVSLDAESVLTAHRTRGNGEYDPLRIVPVAGLPAFIDWAGASLVPPAPLFLSAAGLLP
jgi:hypothetical protein